MALRLYTYWRSSAAYRVRIALALKGLDYESVPRHLLRDGGEQRRADYLALNPQGLVPALEHDGTVVTQSLAICEYLEEVFPRPALLPVEPRPTARRCARWRSPSPATSIRSTTCACSSTCAASSARTRRRHRWVRHWIARGFGALEQLVARHSGDGRHCFGTGVTLADVFLVPQVYNARRAQLDLAPYPRLAAVARHLESLPAFAAARPEAQPDAE